MTDAERPETKHFEALALQNHIGTLFSRLGITCVLDVGANVGFYGQTVRAAGYRDWIVSFEPAREVYRELAEASQTDERWRVFDLALGAQDEIMHLAVTENTVLSSFRRPNDYQAEQLGQMSNITELQEVRVRTLDSVIDECLTGIPDPRLFLKVDTQGWDMEVLRGGMRTLDRALGLQVELSVQPLYEGMPDYLETIRQLNDFGFELTGLYTVIRDSELRVIEFDCLMARVPLPD
jgi:FkbM family methyltransferase